LFHGVQALRMVPVGGNGTLGRSGLLAAARTFPVALSTSHILLLMRWEWLEGVSRRSNLTSSNSKTGLDASIFHFFNSTSQKADLGSTSGVVNRAECVWLKARHDAQPADARKL
jgi:hypothetical protein